MSRTARTGTAVLSAAARAAVEAARAEARRRRAEERRRREEERRRERVRLALEACRTSDSAAEALLAQIELGVTAWTGGTLSAADRERVERLRNEIQLARREWTTALSIEETSPNDAEALALAAVERRAAAEILTTTLRENAAPESGRADPLNARTETLAELRRLMGSAAQNSTDPRTRLAAETGLERLADFAERGELQAFDRLVADVRSDVEAHLRARRSVQQADATLRARAAAAAAQLDEELAALSQECDDIGYRPDGLARLNELGVAYRRAIDDSDYERFSSLARETGSAYGEVTNEVDRWLDQEQERVTVEIAVADALRAAGLRVEPEATEVRTESNEPMRVITARQRDDSELRVWVSTDPDGAHHLVCAAEDLPAEAGRPPEELAVCRDLDDALERVREMLDDGNVVVGPWALADPDAQPPRSAAVRSNPTKRAKGTAQ